VTSLRQQSAAAIAELTKRRREAQQQAESAVAAHASLRAESERTSEALSARVAEQTRLLQAAQQEMDSLRTAAAEAARQAREELSAQRREHAAACKSAQKQLDDQATAHRESQLRRMVENREGQDKLASERSAALLRAQEAEQRAKHNEAALNELRRVHEEERARARELNLPARLSELEFELAAARGRAEMGEQSLAQKLAMIGELQGHITKLENELRAIHQRHEAEIMRLELAQASGPQAQPASPKDTATPKPSTRSTVRRL